MYYYGFYSCTYSYWGVCLCHWGRYFKYSEAMTNIYFALLLIIPEALYEGLRSKHPRISFAIEFLFRLCIAVIIFGSVTLNSDNFTYHVFGYVLLRFAIFDFVYNLSSELPILFVGSTKLYDQGLSKVPMHLVLFVKGIALFIGIVWLLK